MTVIPDYPPENPWWSFETRSLFMYMATLYFVPGIVQNILNTGVIGAMLGTAPAIETVKVNTETGHYLMRHFDANAPQRDLTDPEEVYCAEWPASRTVPRCPFRPNWR